MHRLAILFCALTPSIVFLNYGITKARARWSDRTIWEAFFSGGIVTMFVLLPELLLKHAIATDTLPPAHGAAIKALVIAAAPEEIAKFAALFFAIKRYGGDADRHDMITLSFAVALGFAAIENLFYLIAPGDWQLVALNRALLSVPGHGLDGLTMGAFLTAARLFPHHRPLWLTASLGIPILMHAGYDFPLMLVTRNTALYGVLPAWFLILIFMTIGVVRLCNKMRAAVDHKYGLPARSTNSLQLAGAMILLFVPLLAFIASIQDGHFAIVGTAALFILPSILAMDLLFTRPKLVHATAAMPLETGYQD